MLRTPEGLIDVRAIQARAAEQLKAGVLTDDIKLSVGLLATLTDELESREEQLKDLRVTQIYRDNI